MHLKAAKHEAGNAWKRVQSYGPPNNKDPRNLRHVVAVPSPMEQSLNLQNIEDKDTPSSAQTLSDKSDTREGYGDSDRICYLTERSPPFQEPNLDPLVHTEVSAKVCCSTDLASCDNQELSPTPELNSNQNVREGSSEFVGVQLGEPKNNGSEKNLEMAGVSMPVDSDSTIKTTSPAEGDMKKPEETATAEYLESIRVPNITEEVSDDEIEDKSSSNHVNASKHVSEGAIPAISRESLGKERFQQEPSIDCDSFPFYRTVSSRSMSSALCVETSMGEGLGVAREGHSTRSRTRSDSDELPFHGWGPQVNSVGSEGPLNQMIRGSLYSLYSSSDQRERPEDFLPREKEELLRMVIELENQLKRMQNSKKYNSVDSKFNTQLNNSYFHDQYGATSTYSSSPWSQDYSNLLWDCETEFNDRVEEFLGLKNSMEKTHFPKRHFRPIAGASPLLTCYLCAKLLQIPEDFLLSRRKRCHWLRCGACSIVLRFSLEDGTHISPYPPELNNLDNSIHGKNLEDLRPSDDYGVPICKSCSAEGDPTLLDPTLPLQAKADDDPNVSCDSSENFKPGIEEAPGRKGSSALHKLMGYSSVSQMLS